VHYALRRGLAAALLAGAMAVATAGGASAQPSSPITHVLLISVDGLHQSDLQWYVQNHPSSELAKLTRGGVEFGRARTPIPSDSFPGMVGQLTGGDPRVTGVYYDAEYNHGLVEAGSACSPGGATALGADVTFDESLDQNPDSIDAGEGLPGLPDGILAMTSNPQSVIDQANLPLDSSTCTPVWPHDYLKVNTVFDVAKAHGLDTAWSDKHPAYDILQGASGNAIDDLFTPEINSLAFHSDGTPYGDDWTKDNTATRQYDAYKVQAVINEIDGYDHSRSNRVGVPAIFGMNFQTISTAQKLPMSDGMNGGYLPGTTTPGPLLSDALDWLDGELQSIDNELASEGLSGSTAIILSAKHGQSPIDPTQLVRIDDGPIIDGINNAWRTHVGDPSAPDLVVNSTNDDAILMWLSDRSPDATSFVADWLMSHSATGSGYNTSDPSQRGVPVTLDHSGLVNVYAGEAAADYFGVPAGDLRHPDVWGVVQQGVVYTGGKGKIAEHGGANPENRDVPLVVYAPSVAHGHPVEARVETTQIAPTILQLLGLDPADLRAVQEEGTKALPSIR
jgi:Type I phosphodiesterase / nucleotide pyrophosphatase